MNLSARLRKYLPADVDQKEVATSWIGRMQELGGEGLALSTVTSRLSELLSDSPQGVRTFFRDPNRAKALFEVLSVPQEEWAGLRALAEPLLAGSPQPRLVVDVSDLGADRALMDQVYGRIREALLGDGGIFPVALVLTEEQFDLLPRSFDRFQEELILERVIDPSAGAAAAIRLARDPGCLVSERPLVELRRWWAMSLRRKQLQFEPLDGLAQLRELGLLPVPEVHHALAPIVGEGRQVVVKVPAGGVERRRFILDLADESSEVSKKEPAWRFAAAEALGVQATSTERERIEAALAALAATLSVPVEVGTLEQWDAMVARAARRPTPPLAMRVGDILYALNPEDPIGSAERLRVKRVTCEEPPLLTLERAVSEKTEDDLLDDRHLDGLIQQLAGGDERRLKLLMHARAVLVFGQRLRLKAPTVVKDPIDALRQLLSGDVPEALLRVRVEGEPIRFGSEDCHVNLRPCIVDDQPRISCSGPGSTLINLAPPSGDLLWGRTSKLKGVAPHSVRYSRRSSDWNEDDPLVSPVASVADWLDDVDASAFIGGRRAAPRRNVRLHLPEPYGDPQHIEVPTPGDVWLNADLQLGLTWLALREALRQPRFLKLHNGILLLQIGGGLAARVQSYWRGDGEAPVRAALRSKVYIRSPYDSHSGQESSAWSFERLTSAVTTHVAQTGSDITHISVMMPSIWLSGKGFAADITFVAAPMLAGSPLGNETLLAAAAGSAATLRD